LASKILQLLDSEGIEYRLLPHASPAYTCEAAAEERKVPLGEMIKCILLVDRKKGYYLICTSADRMVDTKKARNMLNSTRLSFASAHQIEEILGYKMGAVPPLLLKEDIPVVFDSGILEKRKVNISSGDPMLGIELQSGALVSLVKPQLGDVAK